MQKFKVLFERQKQALLDNSGLKGLSKGELQLNRDDMLDIVDFTSTEIEQSMQIRLKYRQALYLKKIDGALERIKAGTFGICEDCGSAIEARRMEARPTTTFCVQCKEEHEHQELGHIDGIKPKSVGRKIMLVSA